MPWSRSTVSPMDLKIVGSNRDNRWSNITYVRANEPRESDALVVGFYAVNRPYFLLKNYQSFIFFNKKYIPPEPIKNKLWPPTCPKGLLEQLLRPI